MIRLLQLHLCVLLLCPAVSAQDEELFDHVDRTDDGVAYLEWEATPARPMVGQEVTLRVRFGVSQEFFAEHLVQP
ncbi:MAG: hypothetical protein O2816_16570, partial [Planctomycetota bacterium]|nr:hypothetical protein [Planctomycetota bacterium]